MVYPLKTINHFLDLLQIEQWLHPFPIPNEKMRFPLDDFVTHHNISFLSYNYKQIDYV